MACLWGMKPRSGGASRADIGAQGVGRTTNRVWIAGQACSGYALHLHVGDGEGTSGADGKVIPIQRSCLSMHVQSQ